MAREHDAAVFCGGARRRGRLAWPANPRDEVRVVWSPARREQGGRPGVGRFSDDSRRNTRAAACRRTRTALAPFFPRPRSTPPLLVSRPPCPSRFSQACRPTSPGSSFLRSPSLPSASSSVSLRSPSSSTCRTSSSGPRTQRFLPYAVARSLPEGYCPLTGLLPLPGRLPLLPLDRVRCLSVLPLALLCLAALAAWGVADIPAQSSLATPRLHCPAFALFLFSSGPWVLLPFVASKRTAWTPTPLSLPSARR